MGSPTEIFFLLNVPFCPISKDFVIFQSFVGTNRLSSFLTFPTLKKQTEHLCFKQSYVIAHAGFKHFRGSLFYISICFSTSIFSFKTISRILLIKLKRYRLNKPLALSMSSFIFFWWYFYHQNPFMQQVLEKHLFEILSLFENVTWQLQHQ